jgi:hypothetical protein
MGYDHWPLLLVRKTALGPKLRRCDWLHSAKTRRSLKPSKMNVQRSVFYRYQHVTGPLAFFCRSGSARRRLQGPSSFDCSQWIGQRLAFSSTWRTMSLRSLRASRGPIWRQVVPWRLRLLRLCQMTTKEGSSGVCRVQNCLCGPAGRSLEPTGRIRPRLIIAPNIMKMKVPS